MPTGILHIDLEAIAANWRALDALSSYDCETAATVKADKMWKAFEDLGKAGTPAPPPPPSPAPSLAVPTATTFAVINKGYCQDLMMFPVVGRERCEAVGPLVQQQLPGR